MPFPRPVSPFSLETCATPPHSFDTDALLGSDDELDDAASAAQRQRIEKIAESYLQGKPLFILSAGLKGPLDEEWKNPWEKRRKRGKATLGLQPEKANAPERMVKETDLRAPRFRESLPAGGREHEIPASSLNRAGSSSAQPGARSLSSKSPRRDSTQSASRLGRGDSNGKSRSPAKSSGLPDSSVQSHSIVQPRPADWLKKDRRLMNFTKFDPPSSPTISVASRQSDKARRPPARSVQVQVPQTPGSPSKLQPIKNIPPKTAKSSSNGRTPRSARSTSSTSPRISKVPHIPQQSPFRRSAAIAEPPSLRIVNSSSQLPRFEYRRCANGESRSSLDDESILQEETILHDGTPAGKEVAVASQPASAVNIQSVNTTTTSDPKEPLTNTPSTHAASVQPSKSDSPDVPDQEAVSQQVPPKESESHKTQSKDLRFAGQADIVYGEEKETFQGTAPSTEPEPVATEQNTYEDLPSAQRVPAPLGASDRITSLHSTALPKADTGLGSSTSPDTQLSTQAALLHAQKSFQEDLDSPAYYAATPGQNKAIHSPSGTSYSANVTPFYRIEQSLQRDFEQSSLSADKDRMHATSTQYMLDAATPFNFSIEQAGQNSSWNPTNKNKSQAMDTQFMLDAATPYVFSTEKKPRASLPDLAKSLPTGSKRKKPHDASCFMSPQSDVASMDYEYDSAESKSGDVEGSSSPGVHKSDHLSAKNASLPINPNESASAAVQDGQGANQAVESFNLSQAIADAGSWLQQSFDFVKEIGRPSQNLEPHSLNMDPS